MSIDVEPEDEFSLAEQEDTIYELEEGYQKNTGFDDKNINEFLKRKHITPEQNSLSINETTKFSVYKMSRESNW
jgi:hypothetical protein